MIGMSGLGSTSHIVFVDFEVFKYESIMWFDIHPVCVNLTFFY